MHRLTLSGRISAGLQISAPLGDDNIVAGCLLPLMLLHLSMHKSREWFLVVDQNIARFFLGEVRTEMSARGRHPARHTSL